MTTEALAEKNVGGTTRSDFQNLNLIPRTFSNSSASKKRTKFKIH